MDAQGFKNAILETVLELQTERATIHARLAEIDRKLAAWNVIVGEEGNSTLTPAMLEPGPKVNVMDGVRDLIRASGKTGMLPREIRGELLKAGINRGPQVVTNALSRWKKRDYTVEIDGRHYWKEYLSDIELQKVRPRKRRDPTRRSWEPPTESPS